MNRWSQRRLTTLIFLGAAGLGVLAPAAPALAAPESGAWSASSASPRPLAVSCLSCHGNPDLSMTLASGEKLSLFVDEAEMSQSTHQGKLTCTDCHTRITSVPHKKVQVSDRREYSIAQYEACKRCHFPNYTKTLDGIHYKVMEAGNQNAPLCTDCHGYHNVSKPERPSSRISSSCAQCHSAVYETYGASVHGAALLKEDNRDVPVCTDCHGTHTIRDASTASFRLNSPEMCAKCHANEPLMRRYGISANVFKTYVHDFHGTTVALTRRQGADNWTDKAVCSDCHGVHNIKSARGANAAEVKQNAAATCQKCHPGASANFPDAWLSHYDLTLEKAPLPYLVRAGYTILIPIMIVGLVLHIVVDLWRIARNR